MNVLTVLNGYKGCGYVRQLLPAYHNGYSIAHNQQEFKEKADLADVIVFHRAEDESHYNLAMILKEKGKKIVMDNDDTFILSNHPLASFTPDAVEVEVAKRAKAINKFIGIADLVTTTTKTLADEYRKISDKVVILPNCIDPMDWGDVLRNETDTIRIGLVGSAAFEYDYLHIKDVIRQLDKRKDIKLVMFGLGDKAHRKANKRVTEAFKDDYEFWDSIDIDHIPWCDIEDYPTQLNEARLDMMLIPRQDNYFNRCKSNIKFLEASMCEIPVIAQSFDNGAYEEIDHYNNGLLVRDNKDWMKEIEWLCASKDRRRLIGKTAKQYVLNKYNIECSAHKWDDAYKKMYEEN